MKGWLVPAASELVLSDLRGRRMRPWLIFEVHRATRAGAHECRERRATLVRIDVTLVLSPPLRISAAQL